MGWRGQGLQFCIVRSRWQVVSHFSLRSRRRSGALQWTTVHQRGRQKKAPSRAEILAWSKSKGLFKVGCPTRLIDKKTPTHSHTTLSMCVSEWRGKQPNAGLITQQQATHQYRLRQNNNKSCTNVVVFIFNRMGQLTKCGHLLLIVKEQQSFISWLCTYLKPITLMTWLGVHCLGTVRVNVCYVRVYLREWRLCKAPPQPHKT